MLNYGYYDFSDGPTKATDQQELGALFIMPNILGDSGVVPHYRVVKLWPDGSQVQKGVSGWVHIVGFDYGFNVDIDEEKQQAMLLTTDFVYNDGYFASTVDHDWSHMVFGLSTALDCPALGGKLIPAVYFQNSFEDTVNTEDELWAGISYSLSF